MGAESKLSVNLVMSVASKWLKAEVYPIIGFISGACVWSGYVSYKMFAENPDCSIRKRHNPLDDGFNQGQGVKLFTESMVGSKIANEDNFMDPSRFRIVGKRSSADRVHLLAWNVRARGQLMSST